MLFHVSSERVTEIGHKNAIRCWTASAAPLIIIFSYLSFTCLLAVLFGKISSILSSNCPPSFEFFIFTILYFNLQASVFVNFI